MGIEDNDLNTEWECPTCEAVFLVQKSGDTNLQFVITEPGKRTVYEFTREQNEVIASLASNMKIVGVVSVIAGGLLILAGLVLLARGGVSALIQGVLALIIGGFTVQAAGAFRLIVNSQGDDIGHLMTALGALRSLYRLQVFLLCIALCIAALGLLILLAF